MPFLILLIVCILFTLVLTSLFYFASNILDLIGVFYSWLASLPTFLGMFIAMFSIVFGIAMFVYVAYIKSNSDLF